MVEVQGADGVVWTWGAPASERGVSVQKPPVAGGDGGGDTGQAGGASEGYVPEPPSGGADPVAPAGSGGDVDADADAARAEEEWLAAGMTVRRSTLLPEAEDPPAEGASGAADDDVTRAEEEWEAAGMTIRRPIVPPDPPPDPRPEAPPETPSAWTASTTLAADGDDPAYTWRDGDGQVWVWDPTISEWHRQQR